MQSSLAVIKPTKQTNDTRKACLKALDFKRKVIEKNMWRVILVGYKLRVFTSPF
jgi:hypothetical protein